MTTKKPTKKPTKKTAAKKPAAKARREYVLVRTVAAGVHVGELVSRKGDEVTLASARRIWRWNTTADAVKAYTLSDVSRVGAGSQGKVSPPVGKIVILGACELITCTAEGERALREAPPWQ